MRFPQPAAATTYSPSEADGSRTWIFPAIDVVVAHSREEYCAATSIALSLEPELDEELDDGEGERAADDCGVASRFGGGRADGGVGPAPASPRVVG